MPKASKTASPARKKTKKAAENIAPALTSLRVPLDNLTPMERNARRGDVEAIAKSYARFGQRKPIVVRRTGDNDGGPTGEVIAGNHQLAAARKLGWSHIAAVFVDEDDATARAYALADNRTAELAEWDELVLSDTLAELNQGGWDISDLGFESLDVKHINGEKGEKGSTTPGYTAKVAIPQYEIVGEEPEPEELYDMRKAEELRAAIAKAKLPAEIAEFLNIAASRHIVFNYRKIAEFYPHQTKEIQRLMEQSVLVIIDAEDAIANGFAQFQQTISDLIEEDRDDEA